jgi:IS30 family transposase
VQKQLSVAEIAEETGAHQKTIRAYLRRNHTRSAELKNSRWGDAKNSYRLGVKLTKELIDHFSKPAEEEAEAV